MFNMSSTILYNKIQILHRRCQDIIEYLCLQQIVYFCHFLKSIRYNQILTLLL